MTEEEFLIQLILTNKVSAASKLKSEGVHAGKDIDRATIQKTADTIKAEFVQDGLQYIQYLVDENLRQNGLNSDIVKALAAFDSFILFKRQTNVALIHFDLLYWAFLRRSWVTSANETVCREEYLELLDYSHTCYGVSFNIMDTSLILIEFMMVLEILQFRQNFFYRFKLCCLSVTSSRSQYPPVPLGSISTAGFRDRFLDVILPVQSYMSGIPDSVTSFDHDSNLAKFSSRSAFSSAYDPWTYVDTFGRSKIYHPSLCSLHTSPFFRVRKGALFEMVKRNL